MSMVVVVVVVVVHLSYVCPLSSVAHCFLRPMCVLHVYGVDACIPPCVCMSILPMNGGSACICSVNALRPGTQ